MARTASMSLSEAETLLGARGALSVTTENRATVKKWLVASGFASGFVGTLRLNELQRAYNDTTLDYIIDLREREATWRDDGGADGADDADDADDAVPAPVPVKANGHASPQDAAALLRDLILGGWNPPAAGVDAEQVKQIIRAELPGLIPVQRLEIVTRDETRDLGTAARHVMLPLAIQTVAQGVPLLLVGPAGSGKTTGAEQVAQALGIPFLIQGAVSGAHELTGYCDAHGKYQSTPFRQAYEHGGGLCLDELDAGDAAAILVINAALANGHMSFPDSPLPVARHPDFRVIACANTYGHGADRQYVGRTQLDAATIDRFVTLEWSYDEALERAICSDASWVARVQALRAAAVKEKARIIISPRASINGAKLLMTGLDRASVENICVWRGCDPELRRRIEAAAAARG